ncbi:MAG: hypothetical protein RMK29_10070 [Myxococcales bacterium]|nr:hypothetical protein [Myxococcota bacterium]MDW8282048.1 hypothetical protein [Myxococcales bacterium]
MADSYAAQTWVDRNVGVIGVALFAETSESWAELDLKREARRREAAEPFPSRFAQLPL